jgi:hypothetical protein
MKVNGRSAMHGIPICITVIICFLFISSGCTAPSTSSPPQTPPPEAPSPEVASATDYLQSISNDLYEMYANFGLDKDVADYVLFVSSLPKDFADYALQSKLCIQDRKLTDLEKQFLSEPDTYLQQMFDSYMTDVSNIDPELAAKLKLIPFLKEIEIKDVEALEDIASLAGRAEYRASVEKIYGKGIERTMHPVALEKLVWDCYSSELDEPDLSIHTRLADFQEKYNTEMDAAGPAGGKKPQILGINYLWEPLQWMNKSQEDIRFDYALMRWVLGVNAVKIWGVSGLFGNTLSDHVELAHEEGLEVWLEYCPVYGLETSNPDISVEDYCKQLAGFAQEAERLGVEVLVVGHEVDVHLKRFDYRTGALRRAVDEMVKAARQNYSGLVTYCTWDGPWDVCNVNWGPMDIIFPQIYKSDTTRELTDNEYLSIINKWKNKVPGKPMAISEFGSLTVSEGASIGGWNDLLKTKPYHYDPQAQADFVERQLNVLFKADIHGIFLHCWDEGNVSYLIGYNQSEVGYGIWDWRSNEPKPSFWVAYKYYGER